MSNTKTCKGCGRTAPVVPPYRPPLLVPEEGSTHWPVPEQGRPRFMEDDWFEDTDQVDGGLMDVCPACLESPSSEVWERLYGHPTYWRCCQCGTVYHENSHHHPSSDWAADDRMCRKCKEAPEKEETIRWCTCPKGWKFHCAIPYNYCPWCGGRWGEKPKAERKDAGAKPFSLCPVCKGKSSLCPYCHPSPAAPALSDTCCICGGKASTCPHCTATREKIYGHQDYFFCTACNQTGGCPSQLFPPPGWRFTADGDRMLCPKHSGLAKKDVPVLLQQIANESKACWEGKGKLDMDTIRGRALLILELLGDGKAPATGESL